jgi:hypothetical protein
LRNNSLTTFLPHFAAPFPSSCAAASAISEDGTPGRRVGSPVLPPNHWCH